MMNTTIQDRNDLLSFLITQSGSRKDWFGFQQQKITAISLAHEIAAKHADKMTPHEIVNYVSELNNHLYQKIIKPGA
jgi:PIN domain nuclease of toxin-antitoxin system